MKNLIAAANGRDKPQNTAWRRPSPWERSQRPPTPIPLQPLHLLLADAKLVGEATEDPEQRAAASYGIGPDVTLQMKPCVYSLERRRW